MPNAPTIPLEIGNYLKEEKKEASSAAFAASFDCITGVVGRKSPV